MAATGGLLAQGDPLPRMGTGRGLTDERMEAAVAAYRATGIYARAAEAVGISARRFAEWRKEHPPFQEALDAAGREYDAHIGTIARRALHQELEACLNGVPEWEDALTRDGTKVRLERSRRLNVAAARTALTKLNPEWTHPKQDVALTVTTAGALLDALPGVAEDVPDTRVDTPVLPKPAGGGGAPEDG